MARIAIASDHAGYGLKGLIRDHLARRGYALTDFGTHAEDPVDYPDFIRPAAMSVATGRHDLGIVLGGSGNGEAMVANKIAGVRCAVCWNRPSARLAKEHNNANIIAIGARMVGARQAIKIVDAWMEATFAGGRHVRRIAKIALCEGLTRSAHNLDEEPTS